MNANMDEHMETHTHTYTNCYASAHLHICRAYAHTHPPTHTQTHIHVCIYTMRQVCTGTVCTHIHAHTHVTVLELLGFKMYWNIESLGIPTSYLTSLEHFISCQAANSSKAGCTENGEAPDQPLLANAFSNP